MNVTQVQAFAAGAALCSTSLGTTFTILSTGDLSRSRLGVLLSSAAMIDDVAGLVMSSIVFNLGKSSDFNAITVIRPVFVSVAFAAILPLICLLIVQPIARWAYNFFATRAGSRIIQLTRTEQSVLTFHTSVLVAMVTASSYAGTSNLFAAYLAGASSSWWDGLVHKSSKAGESADPLSREINSQKQLRGHDSYPIDTQVKCAHLNDSVDDGTSAVVRSDAPGSDDSDSHRLSSFRNGLMEEVKQLCATSIFNKYYRGALNTILKPYFFASIGFSIPISKMFSGSVIWRGFVYSILMVLAKMLCGMFLLCLPYLSGFLQMLRRYLTPVISRYWPPSLSHKRLKKPQIAHTSQPVQTQQAAQNLQAVQETPANIPETSPSKHSHDKNVELACPSQIKQHVSLYPAALVGCAMVSRGEIGFLISSVAESNGVFGPSSKGSSELYLVVTWAILLCTLLGPIAVGLMVKRVKRLQTVERSLQTGRHDPLGPWGTVPSH